MKKILYLFISVSVLLESKKPEVPVVVGFMGDIMLGRLVNEVINVTGYSYPWGNTLPQLKLNTINIGNLETTLTHSKDIVPKVFNFKATPDKVRTLQLGGMTVVNLANNHVLDFSFSGMQETIDTLNKAGIAHVGAGATETDARQPVILKRNGITIGVLGYTDNEPGWAAWGLKPGTNYIKVGNIDQAKKDIKAIRPYVDILIVTIHWGPNMRQRPSQEFRDFAHALIDVGVDIIHGHSSHVFQGIEKYKNKLIMYDTGDFIDDYAVDPVLRNDQSFLFEVTITKTGIKQVQLVPVIIKNMHVNVARGQEARAIIDKMRNLSAELNTFISPEGYLFFNYYKFLG